ncbi:hypothetical protein UA74_15840 [Actinoalloteichus fjordicus]|uniref:Uncharacterized protein n=1 Tax=Actinoalloteichus fjordicus TaxID=1612552 RepID=A0AAC9LF87_9PSEU|nr:hypothetical protein UA74_15840 [Actinoalloteichus fjordicus]
MYGAYSGDVPAEIFIRPRSFKHPTGTSLEREPAEPTKTLGPVKTGCSNSARHDAPGIMATR